MDDKNQNPVAPDVNNQPTQATSSAALPAIDQAVVSNHSESTTKPKSQTVAFVLAFCFGLFAWLYTYKYPEDRKKFWINFGLFVVTFGGWSIVGWIWAMIDIGSRKKEYYDFYPA